MRHIVRIGCVILLAAGLFAAPEISAQDERVSEPKLSGEVGLILRAANGENGSAKFEEYRDISDPVSGDAELLFGREGQYRIRFEGFNLGGDDRSLDLSGNWYGTVKAGIHFDRVPHRFAFGARTLYSGVGTDSLTLPPALRNDLQSGAIPPTQAFSQAAYGDPEVDRERFRAFADIPVADPFAFRIEVQRDERDGTRPTFGAFQTDTVEIPQPVDDSISTIKVLGEYTRRPWYIGLGYQFSKYENDLSTLTWDNPFQLLSQFDPTRGRLVLEPDNLYHHLSLTASRSDLPGRTRITAVLNRGWMIQDDDLIPYTVNDAAVGVPEVLPKNSADAKAATTLAHLRLTSRPMNRVHINAKFRYFDYDNQTDRIAFPGEISADGFWIATPLTTLPTSYRKTEGGADVGFDFWKATRFTVGYEYRYTERTNRETESQKDHLFRGSLDSRPVSWLELNTSYERTQRNVDDYDYQAPLSSIGASTALLLPQLVKYDQADMVRDRVRFRATVFPIDALALGGSVTYGRDDFEDSAYGLLDDKHYIIGFDADYTFSERLGMYAFYSYEHYENRQKDRGSVETVTADWFSKSEDTVHTVGGGIKAVLIPQLLESEVKYTFSDVDGTIDFYSPASPTIPFDEVDNSRFHLLEALLKYHFRKDMTATFGFLWEKFEYADFDTQGFTYTPADAIFMGTLPDSYDANIFYARLSYRF